jgi:hypothetical protein
MPRDRAGHARKAAAMDPFNPQDSGCASRVYAVLTNQSKYAAVGEWRTFLFIFIETGCLSART